jgi:hypothetical protein
MRQRISFNANWFFSLGDAPGAEQPGFDASAWQPASLPHDWSIAGPFREDHPSGGRGGYLPGGIGWYRKTFQITEVSWLAESPWSSTASTRTALWAEGPGGFHPYGTPALLMTLPLTCTPV